MKRKDSYLDIAERVTDSMKSGEKPTIEDVESLIAQTSLRYETLMNELRYARHCLSERFPYDEPEGGWEQMAETVWREAYTSFVMQNRGSLATLTSIAGLSRKLRSYFSSEFCVPEVLVEIIAEKGWKYIFGKVPGFGKVYAERLYTVLITAEYKVEKP